MIEFHSCKFGMHLILYARELKDSFCFLFLAHLFFFLWLCFGFTQVYLNFSSVVSCDKAPTFDTFTTSFIHPNCHFSFRFRKISFRDFVFSSIHSLANVDGGERAKLMQNSKHNFQEFLIDCKWENFSLRVQSGKSLCGGENIHF